MNPYTTLKIGDIVKHNPSGCKAEVIGIYQDLIWLKFPGCDIYKHVIAPAISPWVSEKKYKMGDLVLTKSLTNEKRILEIRKVIDVGYLMKDIEGELLVATYDDKDIFRKVGVATEGG